MCSSVTTITIYTTQICKLAKLAYTIMCHWCVLTVRAQIELFFFSIFVAVTPGLHATTTINSVDVFHCLKIITKTKAAN